MTVKVKYLLLGLPFIQSHCRGSCNILVLTLNRLWVQVRGAGSGETEDRERVDYFSVHQFWLRMLERDLE